VVRLFAVDLRREAGDLGIVGLLQAVEPDRVCFLVQVVARDRLRPVQQPKLDELRIESDKAQRDGDLATASRLLYGEIPAVEREIAEAEAREQRAGVEDAIGPVPDPMHCQATTLGATTPSSDRQWLTADRNGRAYITDHEFVSAQPRMWTTTNGGADQFVTPCGPIVTGPGYCAAS